MALQGSCSWWRLHSWTKLYENNLHVAISMAVEIILKEKKVVQVPQESPGWWRTYTNITKTLLVLALVYIKVFGKDTLAIFLFNWPNTWCNSYKYCHRDNPLFLVRKNKIQLQSAFKAAFYITCKDLPRHMSGDPNSRATKGISRAQEGAVGRSAPPLKTSWYPQERRETQSISDSG